MWKLHRYYLKEVAANAFLTFAVLFGIVLVAMVYRGIDRAKGADLVSAAAITFFYAADTFPHLLTISLLMASVLAFARASQDREITAIRAAGISPRVPMVSAVLIGLLFSIGGSYAQHYMIPWAHYYKYRVTSEIIRNFLVNTQMSGNKVAFGRTVITWERDDERGHLHDVLIRRPGQLISAKEAWLDLSADGETMTLATEKLELLHGATGRLSGRSGLSFSMREFNEGKRRNEGDKDITSDQLLAEVERGVHENPGGARYTVHQRSCFALMPFLLTPIGFCIGVLARDRGRMTAILFAMVPLVLFYGCVLIAPSLVRSWDQPWLAWLPAMVIGLLGAPFCWRLLRV